MRPLLLLTFLLAPLASACADPEPRVAAEAPPAREVSLALPADTSVADLLLRLGGRFERSVRVPGLMEFVGDDRLFRALREAGDSVVPALVDCLDSREPSATMVDSTRMVLGALCAEALVRSVLVEPADEHGDIDPMWPGDLSFTPTPEEQAAAKRAWLRVLETRQYLLKRDM